MKTFLQATAALAVVVIIAGGGFLLGEGFAQANGMPQSVLNLIG